jgi:glycine hydroxymethyltransferase
MAREGHAVLDREDPEAKAPGEYAVEAADGDETLAAPEMGLQSAGAGALVDITKPFFVGQRAIEGQFEAKGLRAWAPPHIERPKPLPRTLLGEAHEKLGVAQWGAFGSATMPIQYAAGPNAIPAEHYATRCGAALYDVSHMLPIIVRGRDARAFLEMCLVNSVYGLAPGRCQYTALCRPDGAPQDDLYLNFLEHNDATGEDVLLVVGNSGHESDYYLLKALAAGDARIDAEMPGKRFEGEVRFVSRLEGARGKGRWDDPLYSVALQGPKSREIILAAVSEKDRKRVGAMEFNDLLTRVRPASGAGELVVTRTGYAGEPMGFEIYTTAGHLVELWEGLLALGATPAGLGARDSTRQEAGLPLFGHEIDGALRIPLSGGRMPRLVRFEKAFFVGRRGALDAERKRTKRVFLLSAEGPRKVSEGWPVYTPAGEFLGHVTSTSTVRPGRTDAAQAYLEEDKVKVGDKVVVTSPSRVPNEGQAPEGRVFAVSTWDKARDYKCEG